MIKFLAVLAILAGAWAAGAWFLMITVGIVHAEWVPAVPPVSYNVSLLLTTLAALHGGFRAAMGQLVQVIMR